MGNELAKSIISPELARFQENDNRDLSANSKEKEIPPWKVTTTKFEILSPKQKDDLGKVNKELDKIRKQLETTQTVLNETLGRLVTILKAIEDPLALLFLLLASEILKLDAVFNNNAGLFMLDDVSEQIKVKFTLFGKEFDASGGLNIAGGINNTAINAKNFLYKKLTGKKTDKTTIPTPTEIRELQKKDLRLKEFISLFDEYNQDVVTMIDKIISVYTKAETSFIAVVGKDVSLVNGNTAQLKLHYLAADKNLTGTEANDKNVITYFRFPSLAKKLKKFEGKNYDREAYLDIIVEELIKKIYLPVDTLVNTKQTPDDLDNVLGDNAIIVYPTAKLESSLPPKEDEYQINYAYSTLIDTDYLNKVFEKTKKSSQSSFIETQQSVLSNNIDKAMFSLVGQALYEFEKIISDKSLQTQFDKRIKTYAIIEKYFKSTELLGEASKQENRNTQLKFFKPLNLTKVKLGTVLSVQADAIKKSFDTVSSVSGITEAKTNYKNYFFFRNDSKSRIETRYGLDLDVATLNIIKEEIINTCGAIGTGGTESKERLVLSQITNKIQSLIGIHNQTDVHTPNATVSRTGSTDSNRTVISKPESRGEDAASTVVINSETRNQIKIIEESLARQIDTINSFEDIRRYKQEYYTKTIDSFTLSLQNKFSKLQEVYDRIKSRGSLLSTQTRGQLAGIQLLDPTFPLIDQFVAEMSILIQIINSIKATFQPFLFNKINVISTQNKMNAITTSATETRADTIKKILNNEKDWNEQIVGDIENSVKKMVEGYLDQFKKLLVGGLIDDFKVDETIKKIKDGEEISEIEGLSDLGNVLILYQDGFEGVKEKNDGTGQHKHLGTVFKTDGSEDDLLFKKQIFVRYYGQDNLERLQVDYNIVQPGNFLKENRIIQKMRQLQKLVIDNLQFNRDDSIGVIDSIVNKLNSINDFLCSKDDSDKKDLSKDVKDAIKDAKKSSEIQLGSLKNQKKEYDKELADNIQKIDYTHNSSTKNNQSAKQLVEETNKLISKVGGFKYLYDDASKTIKLSTTVVEGTETKKINDLQLKLDAIENKKSSALLSLASSSTMESSLTKLDLQIAITKQTINELERKEKNSGDKIKNNELKSLEDLRKKITDGKLVNASEVNFLNKTLEKSQELLETQREFARIEDDFNDVRQTFVSEEVFGGSIIKVDTADISLDEFIEFTEFIFEGNIDAFVKSVHEITGNFFAFYKELSKFDLVLSGIKFDTDWKYSAELITKRKVSDRWNEEFSWIYAFQQEKDSKYPTYDGKIFTRAIFLDKSLIDPSFDFIDDNTDFIINKYIEYLNFTFNQIANTLASTPGNEESAYNYNNFLKDAETFIQLLKNIYFKLLTNDFHIVPNDTSREPIGFNKLDITTKLNYFNYKSYYVNPNYINSTTITITESQVLFGDADADTFLKDGYKQVKGALELSNSAFLLPIKLRKEQFNQTKTKFDEDIKKLSQGAISAETTDNRGFFQLMLRSKNEWIEQIITAFTNEDDKRRPIFPDDISSSNPLKVFDPPKNTSSSVQLVDDQDVENIKKILGDLTGGVNTALGQINKNTDMAVIFYVITASDVVALFNKISPIYDIFIGLKEGKDSVLIVKFQEYTSKIEKTFSEISDAVNELYDDLAADAKSIVDTATDIRDNPLNAAKRAAKSFISFDCSEEKRVEDALKFSTKLPDEFASGIIHKWVSLKLKDIPPFSEISKLSLGLAGFLKGLARPKIGLAKIVERILNNLNKKINLLKKIVKGINLMIEFIDFIGSFQIDAATIELEGVRSVSFVEQALRTAEQFPKPFGVSTDDDKMFIASVAFVMPMPFLPIFKKFFKITDKKDPTPFVSTLLNAETTTVINPDRTITTTVTNPDGSVTTTITVINPDGTITNTSTTVGVINTTENIDGDTLII